MKKFFSFLFILLATYTVSQAQWTNDPANPQVVSNAVNVQSKVTTITDGAGGVFVFWLDGRDNNNRNVYGQHYDNMGNILWDVNGREVVNYVPDIVSYKLIADPSDNSFIIATISHQSSFIDSARVTKIDTDGAPVWSNDILAGVTSGCSGTSIIYIDNIALLKDNTAYTVMMTVTYCGGSNGNRIGHFTSNGTYTSSLSGEPEGNQYYIGSPSMAATEDGTDDVYVYYSNGNGAGAHGSCLRVSAVGDTIWGPVDVLESTNGLNYEYRAVSDNSGITFAFVSTGSGGNRDIFLRKIDSAGNWAWSNSITTVCGAVNDQDNFYLTQDANYYYLVWADGRVASCGNYNIYSQKINKSTGIIEWTSDGVLHFDQCTYIPYPKMLPLLDGKIMVTNESTDAANSFLVNKVNEDGTTTWTTPITISNSIHAPFYDDYIMVESGANKIVAWSNNNDVFICRIQQPIVSVNDTLSACSQLTAYGQTFTQSGTYTIDISEDTTVTLIATIDHIDNNVTQDGFTLTANQAGAQYNWINCVENSSTGISTQDFTAPDTGFYAVILQNGTCVDTSDCIHILPDLISPFNSLNAITAFPNPFSNSIIITNAKGYHLSVYDVSGRLVMEKNLVSDSENISASFTKNGNYFCHFRSQSITFVKMITKINE